MNNDEENRKLAEWLEWTELYWHPVVGWFGMPPTKWPHSIKAGGTLPDFRRDPAMTLALLHALSEKSEFSLILTLDPNGHTTIDGLGIPAVSNANLQEAVRLAALAFIEASESRNAWAPKE